VSKVKFFNSIKLVAVTTLICVFLVNCATNKQNQQSKIPTTVTDDGKLTGQLTAEQYLSKAANEEPTLAVQTLLSASQQFIAQHNYVKALWLANQSIALTNNPIKIYDFTIVKAQSLYQLNRLELAVKQLANADKLEQNYRFAHRHHYYQLLADIQNLRKLPIAAIEAQLHALNFKNIYTEIQLGVETNKLWQQLSSLSEWQVQQLVKRTPPNIKGWQQLLNFANRFGHQINTFNRYLTQWQRDFPNHRAQSLIATLQNKTTEIQQPIENVAIILPLSGNRRTAGKSAQQGILAAYNNNENKTLHFIDSNQLEMASLAEKFAELSIDYVIGPLLKPQVNAYLAQTDISLPTLLLNLPENKVLPQQYSALSMLPEEQAIQAATTLSNRNYQHPIIFSHQDQVSKRIASTFAAQWLKITGKVVDIIYFDPNAEMQGELKASFDIDLSEKRISDLQRRIKQTLKVEARNRRDLDMIYLVGSSRETRLLKPYIDVNTSQFSTLIPVFASSRSHSDRADRSDSRDLAGLVFTEMPWLLPSDQQNKSLKQLNKKLWPQKSDGLQRIFAMGYDSLTLINKLEQMKTKTFIRHYGQTGVLQLTANNILIRSLLWGSYQRDKVEQIAME